MSIVSCQACSTASWRKSNERLPPALLRKFRRLAQPFFDLHGDWIHSVPDSGGAYALGTSDGTMLTHPRGSSPIFYIGKADDLSQRLSRHRNINLKVSDAREGHDRSYWWSRYQIGAAFGADCAYCSRRGPENVQNIESGLVTKFYEVFGSIFHGCGLSERDWATIRYIRMHQVPERNRRRISVKIAFIPEPCLALSSGERSRGCNLDNRQHVRLASCPILSPGKLWCSHAIRRMAPHPIPCVD